MRIRVETCALVLALAVCGGASGNEVTAIETVRQLLSSQRAGLRWKNPVLPAARIRVTHVAVFPQETSRPWAVGDEVCFRRGARWIGCVPVTVVVGSVVKARIPDDGRLAVGDTVDRRPKSAPLISEAREIAPPAIAPAPETDEEPEEPDEIVAKPTPTPVAIETETKDEEEPEEKKRPYANYTGGLMNLSPFVHVEYTVGRRTSLGVKSTVLDAPTGGHGVRRGWMAQLTATRYFGGVYRNFFLTGGIGLVSGEAVEADFREPMLSPAFAGAIGWRWRIRDETFNLGIAVGVEAYPGGPSQATAGAPIWYPALHLSAGYSIF